MGAASEAGLFEALRLFFPSCDDPVAKLSGAWTRRREGEVIERDGLDGEMKVDPVE